MSTSTPRTRPSAVALAAALAAPSRLAERLAAEDATARAVIGPLARHCAGFLQEHFEPGRAELFVLLHAGGRMHYLGTVDRTRGTTMLGDLLALWRAGMPDPAAEQLAGMPKAERLARLLVGRVVAAYTEAARENPDEVLAYGYPEAGPFRTRLEEACEAFAHVLASRLDLVAATADDPTAVALSRLEDLVLRVEALEVEARLEDAERRARLMEAVEGECDGLAITKAQADAILRHVEGLPPFAATSTTTDDQGTEEGPTHD